jgi:hypothetical protein
MVEHPPRLPLADASGWTPLHSARTAKRATAAQAFLDAGASVDAASIPLVHTQAETYEIAVSRIESDLHDLEIVE